MLKNLIINVPFATHLARFIREIGVEVDYLDTLEITIERCSPVRRAHVSFAVPMFHSTLTGELFHMAVKIPFDAIASIPMIFTDTAGHTLAGDTQNVSAAVTDPTVALAAVTSDGQWVQITPLILGTSTVTYRDNDDNITATLDFSVVMPSPGAVTFNETGLVLVSNPNPPAGAPGSTITGAASTVGGAGSTVDGAGSTVGGAASVAGAGDSTVSGAAA